MDQKILDIIHRDFKADEVDRVVKKLSSIRSRNMMGASEHSVRLAVLQLAEGNLHKVYHYTKSAKSDFRDVMMWATQKG